MFHIPGWNIFNRMFVPVNGLVVLGTMAIFARDFDGPFANPAKFFRNIYALASKIV